MLEVLAIIMLAKFTPVHFVNLLQLSDWSQCIRIWTQFVGSCKYLSSCHLEADGQWQFAWTRVSCGKTNADRVCLLCFLPLFFIFLSSLPRIPVPGAKALLEPSLEHSGLGQLIQNSMFRRIMFLTLGCKGDQNMPPPNIPLWHKNYFKWKVIEKEQIAGKAPYLPFLYWPPSSAYIFF